MVVNEKDLNWYKKTIQGIINKYLPKESRFSVMDMNQEQIYYIAQLLSEKDDEKRKTLWKEIENKSKEAEKELRKDYIEILSLKEKYDNTFKSATELDILEWHINADKELLKQLEN